MAGIGKDRLHLEWLSSAEAQRFTEVAKNVTASVQALGKLDQTAFELQLEAAEMTVNGEVVRWLVGKEVALITKGDVYGRKWNQDEYEAILHNMLEREYQKNLIYMAIKKGCQSVRDVSDKTGIAVLRVSYLLADLERTSQVEFTGMAESKPVFAAL